MQEHASRSSDGEVFDDIRKMFPSRLHVPRRPFDYAFNRLVQQLNSHGPQHHQAQLRYNKRHRIEHQREQTEVVRRAPDKVGSIRIFSGNRQASPIREGFLDHALQQLLPQICLVPLISGVQRYYAGVNRRCSRQHP